MGFEEVLRELEARRAGGAGLGELVDAAPDELLRAAGYFGPAAGAPAAIRAAAERQAAVGSGGPSA